MAHARRFLSLQADWWTAIGVWATLLVYLVIAIVGYRQLREAQSLRAAQSRPFVIVDVSFRSFLIELLIANIGATAASDVQIQFDEPLTSSDKSPDWQHSTAFTDGIALMAPGREIRFFLDSFPTRVEQGLPMVIRGSVSYQGLSVRGKDRYVEQFVIDLKTYEGSQLPKKGLHELVEKVEDISKQTARWGDRNAGVYAHVSDRDRERAREFRAYDRRVLVREYEERGLKAAGIKLYRTLRRRIGL